MGDTMTNFIKTQVSKEKRRYIKDGYNLDLTYITDRIIAMGFPASNMESLYRNNLEDVRKLLEEKHKDHYYLYNLCSERSYDVAKFQNRVAFYPFDDHNPPEFSMINTFCKAVDEWLAKNKENIAVVHCKAGKGRTGLMICSYLLHCQHNGMTTSEEVLKYYASKRTHDDKGVTIPSQRRYVDYYAAMRSDELEYSPVKLYLDSIVIDPVPSLGINTDSYIQFEVRQKNIRAYESEPIQIKKSDSITIKLPEALLLLNDVKIEVTHSADLFGTKKYSKLNKFQKVKFHFWINTFFIDQERSTDLTHDIHLEDTQEQTYELAQLVPSTMLTRSAYLTHESLTSRPSLPASSTTTSPIMVTSSSTKSSEAKDSREDDFPASLLDEGSGETVKESPGGERNCRSAHNSGEIGGVMAGGGGGGSTSNPVPLPGQLRPNHRSDPGNVTASDDTLDTRSPNGSFVPNLKTFGRSGRTVTYKSPDHQVDSHCDMNLKAKCVSDDTLMDQHPLDTTQSSFNDYNDRRQRHRSVPMMSKTGSSEPTPRTPIIRNIKGKMMSVRLKKHQIDKADKDSSRKFADKFNVTLFLIRPSNQTLEEEFLRPNSYAQHAAQPNSAYRVPPVHHGYFPGCGDPNETPESSDEDEFESVFHGNNESSLTSNLKTTSENHQSSWSDVFPPVTVPAVSSTEDSAPLPSQFSNGASISLTDSLPQPRSSGIQPYLTSVDCHSQHPANDPPPAVPARRNHRNAAQAFLDTNGSSATNTTTTTSPSGMVRNQSEPVQNLCRKSTQTTWI